MSLESVKKHLKKFDKDKDILYFDSPSRTVQEAAKDINCMESDIAKTLSFYIDNQPIVIVMSGDKKVSSSKFKKEFKIKPKMIPREEVLDKIGHEPGAVCPFGLNKNVKVYLDESLKDHEYIYPACGSTNSAIKLKLKELEEISNYIKYVNVTK